MTGRFGGIQEWGICILFVLGFCCLESLVENLLKIF